MPSITQALIRLNSVLPGGNRPGKKMTPRGIIVHRTGNPNTSARANRGWFDQAHGNGRESSAHYIVDQKEILLCIPEDEVAWHCAGVNSTHIGIEVCEPLTLKTYENFIWLVADICKRHNFKATPDFIQPHSKYDPVNRKYCAWNWQLFVQGKDSPYNLYSPFKFFEDVRKEMIGVINVSGMFKDVPDNHWAKASIEALGQMGILGGKTPGNFVPNDNVTRAELAVVIHRVIQKVQGGAKLMSIESIPDVEVEFSDNPDDVKVIQGEMIVQPRSSF